MQHDRVLALGFFDGIHLGHAALLNKTRERARELSLTPAAMSFDTGFYSSSGATSTFSNFQISLTYSSIVLSEENFPLHIVFIIAILDHLC